MREYCSFQSLGTPQGTGEHSSARLVKVGGSGNSQSDLVISGWRTWQYSKLYFCVEKEVSPNSVRPSSCVSVFASWRVYGVYRSI